MKQPGWSEAEEKVRRLKGICPLGNISEHKKIVIEEEWDKIIPDQTEDELLTLLCILNSNSYQGGYEGNERLLLKYELCGGEIVLEVCCLWKRRTWF